MGEGWRVAVFAGRKACVHCGNTHEQDDWAEAVRLDGPEWDEDARIVVSVNGYGPAPQAAAEACWEAWREATKAERKMDNLAGWDTANHDGMALLYAERANADRLAGALLEVMGIGPTIREDDVRAALAAHRALRGDERRGHGRNDA